jgi:predicted Ser/Thr protein kinase
LIALNLAPQSYLAGETQAPVGGSAVPPLPVDEVAGFFPKLEILRLVGTGGMGAVYLARQPALDRHVALKLLHTPPASDPGFAERFAQEARALAKLNHPNIVALYEFGEAGGRPYFLMEFVDGVNLRELQRAERLSPREALQIVPQVCDALQYAHDEGIVHRDIKPENVLVDRKGRVKVADFGLAKLMGLETAATRLTGAGHVMGTPHYMAPEQVEHPLAVDHRADIFSLGVVFYELLTGELPLGKFPLPSKKVRIDVRLDEVVLRALEKEPALRYGQASELKTRVEAISDRSSLPPAYDRNNEQVDAKTKPTAQTGADTPRLSRPALAGVALACLPFLILIIGPVITGPVDIADRTTQIWISLWQGIAFLAAVSATVLSWVAAGQIRRSPDTRYGMGLSVTAGLLFPLLALTGGITVLCMRLFQSLGSVGLVLLLLLVVALNAWIVRKVWRGVAVKQSATGVIPATPPRMRFKRVRWLLAVFVVFIGAGVFLIVKKNVDAHRERARTELMEEVSAALSDALGAEQIQYDHISMSVLHADGWRMRAKTAPDCTITEPRRLRRVAGREDQWVPLKGDVVVEKTKDGWTVRGTGDLADIVITKTGSTLITGARAHGMDAGVGASAPGK